MKNVVILLFVCIFWMLLRAQVSFAGIFSDNMIQAHRSFKVSSHIAAIEENDVEGRRDICFPESVGEFSAVAFDDGTEAVDKSVGVRYLVYQSGCEFI